MPKKNQSLALALVSDPEIPVTHLNIPRWLAVIAGLAMLILLLLASITVYGWLDPQANRTTVNNLSTRSNSGTREQEQEKLIKLGEDRLIELQKENSARKKDVEDLEQRVLDLSTSIKSLQQLAKEIEQRIPGGGVQPAPTPGAGQPPNSAGSGGPNSPKFSGLDSRQTSNYTTQFNKVVADLNSVNASLTDGKHSLATLDIQVQSYRAALGQQKSALDAENARILAATRDDEGNAPPNVLPGKCALTSPFGMRWSPFVSGVRQMHYGVDLGCFEGSPVAATKAGIVTYIGFDPGYGNRVEVTHIGGWRTLYGHNNRVLAKVGQAVKKGDIIALSGNTGASTGPHIHYEVHDKGIPVDPLKYLTGALPAIVNN